MVTRKIDHLGRVVIPKAYRDQLNIQEGAEMQVDLVDGAITIKPISCYSDEEWEYIGSILDQIMEEDYVLVDNEGNPKYDNCGDRVVSHLNHTSRLAESGYLITHEYTPRKSKAVVVAEKLLERARR
jgi:AbrB family looped-hinge helix DNA binding protein